MRNPECRAALVTIFKLILAASPALSLLPAFPPQRRDRENADCIGGALIDRRRGRRGGTREAGSAGIGEGQGGGERKGEEGAGKRKGGGRGSGKTGKGVGKRKRGSEEEKREVGRANGAEDTRKREWKKKKRTNS